MSGSSRFATVGETTAPSRVEQSADVDGALLLLVLLDTEVTAASGFCNLSVSGALGSVWSLTGSQRVEHDHLTKASAVDLPGVAAGR